MNHSKIQQKEKQNKTILLIDFQLINYYSFLKGLTNTNYNLIFLNSRRPIIWNRESLKISKNINLNKMQLDKKKDDKESKKKIKDIKEYIDELQEEVYNKAIADARAKAKERAKSLGVRLGKIVSVNEGGYPTPYYGRAYAEDSIAFPAIGGVLPSPVLVAPEIPAGENKITSQVTIVFEIK